MDRAQELYSSMLLRGFRGEFPYAGTEMPKLKECGCLAANISLFILFRNTNVTALLGTMLLSSF
ncbi:MAG: hypothetical protein IJW67_13690 [Blautia sp.]|nr:hypothetical protein [Blautia sp.]